MDNSKGRVLDIQRMSTEDGPGLRTTVFFKGCPLSCEWCHNPESISPMPELVWEAAGCLGCSLCVEACSENALAVSDTGISIDRSRCQSCGRCADRCPTLSLILLGRLWDESELLNELKKDAAYFNSSKGGVTLSGGEATLQHEFIRSVLKGLKAWGIHTALDTCGMASPGILKDLLPHVDLLLYDIKEMDSNRHKSFTGAGNGGILETLVSLKGPLEKNNTELWIRTPIIPGATDRRDNIRQMGKFIHTHLGTRVSRWELCAFNPLGNDKYIRLGKAWAYEGIPSIDQACMDELKGMAICSGMESSRVFTTGPVRPVHL